MRAAIGLIFGLIACAHPAPDWRDEPMSTPIPSIPRAALAPAVKPTPTVEAALAEFAAVRKSVAERYKQPGGWPLELQDVWLRLISALEVELAVGREVDRRTLIRARVATEVELDRTTTDFGPCPPGVAERLGKVYGLISHHIRALREDESRPTFEWPVSPVIVTSGFGSRFDPLRPEQRFHAGLDLGGSSGDVVSAAGTGLVLHAGWLGGYGLCVVVSHKDGIETLYGHLRKVFVEPGGQVRIGDALGLMGSSGRSTGPHLHFETRRDGAPVDPHELVGLIAEDRR